ncbi:MAG: MBL fold metallo-hydrolase [Candidatus Bathyarchaeota archaeon]|nr:MBL fold metallo-hydrolase [Candidatus Bathyarchaeota archaeon]
MPQIYDLGQYSDVLKDVHLIVGEGLCSNIYVVGKEKATVIDTGVGNRTNPVWPQLEELGIKPENVSKVILTHAHHDHAMGAFIILERASPKIYVHEKDTQYIAYRFGELLVKVNEGDIIETELWPLEVYWTPGHTSGSMCLYNKEKKILFSGDTVFPDGNYGRYDGESGSLEAIIGSLEKMNKLDVEVMLAGHGSPVFSDANKHIEQSFNQASRPRY